MKFQKYEIWKKMNSPKTALAPMVDMNDLAFRLLCRKYGTNLTFTQMFNIKTFINGLKENMKYISPEIDNPCVIQLCGNDPELFLKSYKEIDGKFPCLDVNLGCPQNIAKSGHYGAFLLDDVPQVKKIIGYLCNNKNKTGISCKIRLFNNLNETFKLVQELNDYGIDFLAVHGRTKEQNKEKVGKCNF